MRMCFQLAKKNCCTALAFILILLAQLVIAPLPLAHAEIGRASCRERV